MASRLYKAINPCSWISAKFIAFNVSNNSSQVYLYFNFLSRKRDVYKRQVNLSALHQFFFLLPVNLDNLHLISHSSKCFCSQFYIYARRYTILIQIIVWWIVVAAEGNDWLFCFFFTIVCVFTPCKGCLLYTSTSSCQKFVYSNYFPPNYIMSVLLLDSESSFIFSFHFFFISISSINFLADVYKRQCRLTSLY